MQYLLRNGSKLSNTVHLCTLITTCRRVHHVNILQTCPKNISNNIARSAHTNRPKLPTIVFLPQIFSFCSSKMKFKWLQKKWDPDFTEGGLIYGSSQAISTITKIIHEDKPEKLDGLLTPAARQQLEFDMKVFLKPEQKRIIAVDPSDLKLLVPQRVQLLVNDWKDAETEGKAIVLLKSVALKWHEQVEKKLLRVVFIVFVVEMSRVYEPGVQEGWLVSYFKVKKCEFMKSQWKL